MGWPRLSETLLPALLPSPLLSQGSEQHCDLRASLPPLYLSRVLPLRSLGLVFPSWPVTLDGPQMTSVHDAHTFLYITQPPFKLGWSTTISDQRNMSRNNTCHFQVKLAKNLVCLPLRVSSCPHLLADKRWEGDNTSTACSPVFSLGGRPPRRF